MMMNTIATPRRPVRPKAARGSLGGYNLTERQAQVLDLVVQGLSNRQIAERLGLRFYSVTTHVKNIYGKLGVNRRTNAVAKILRAADEPRAMAITGFSPVTSADRD